MHESIKVSLNFIGIFRPRSDLDVQFQSFIHNPYGSSSCSSFHIDCKTVVFFHFRKARSAVSVILACEAREPQTPVGRVRRGIFSRLSLFSLAVSTLAPDLSLEYLPRLKIRLSFEYLLRLLRSQKIRLFCSLRFICMGY